MQIIRWTDGGFGMAVRLRHPLPVAPDLRPSIPLLEGTTLGCLRTPLSLQCSTLLLLQAHNYDGDMLTDQVAQVCGNS